MYTVLAEGHDGDGEPPANTKRTRFQTSAKPTGCVSTRWCPELRRRAPPFSVLHLLTHDPLPARVEVEHVLKPLPAPGAHRHQVVACLVGPRVAVVQAPG